MNQRLHSKLANESVLLVTINRENGVGSHAGTDDELPATTWLSLLGAAFQRATLWLLAFMWAGAISAAILVALPAGLVFWIKQL